MFAGLFGSLFFEIMFLVVFNFRPGNPVQGHAVVRDSAVHDLCPGASCSGLVAGCEAGSRGTSSAERKTTATLQDQLRAASLYARNLRSRNAHCWQEEG